MALYAVSSSSIMSHRCLREWSGGMIQTRSMFSLISRSTSSVPSHTSRWFSFDFGLIHFINLDLNMYYGTGTNPGPCTNPVPTELTCLQPLTYHVLRHRW